MSQQHGATPKPPIYPPHPPCSQGVGTANSLGASYGSHGPGTALQPPHLPPPPPPYQILQADGSNYCACVNAATLAIIDAGIALRDFVCAGSAGLAEDAALADLSYIEEAAGGPQAALAMLPGSGAMALVQMDARLHHERLEAVMDAAAAACRAVHAVLEEAVRERAREVTALLGE